MTEFADLPDDLRLITDDKTWEILGVGGRAHFLHKTKWLNEANSPKRKGKQIPPEDDAWGILLFLCGRGFGKTRSITEYLFDECWRYPGLIAHYVAPTLADVRGTIFEGPAGLCSIIPKECLLGGDIDKAYNKTTHELRLSNGSLFRGFSATEEAGRLRGPQCHVLGGDELREWDKPAGNLEQAMNNALLGLRLPYPDGRKGRAIFGTTPKPIPYLKRFGKRPDVRVVTGTSRENLDNLSDTFRNQLLSMAGTLMGRQEIDGLYIDEESDLSIVKRHWIKIFPAYADVDRTVRRKLPDFQFIIEIYDTAMEEEHFDVKTQTVDPSASIVLGVFNMQQAFDEKELRKMGVRGRYGALLLDCWSERLGFPELVVRARAQHKKKWGPDPGKKSDIVLIEAKASGISLRQTLATFGVPCWPYNPGRESKVMRMHAQAPLVKQGVLWVPESVRSDRAGLARDWCEEFLEQVCAFAGEGSVEHDDYVDCVLGETGIYTGRGVIPIAQVIPGDMVLTHKGRWREVKHVGSRQSSHYHRLKAKGLEEIGITGNHRVLAMTIAASQRVGKEVRGVDWVRTDALRPRPIMKITKKDGRTVNCVRRVIHDGLVVPRIAGSVDWVDLSSYFLTGEMAIREKSITPLSGKRIPTDRFVKLDAEAGWCFGLFAAEGCVSGHQIIWNCDAEAIARVAEWAQTRFGRVGSLSAKREVHGFSLGSAALIPLFKDFGYMASGKVVPKWCLEAPIEFVRGFVDGYAHGDGHRFRDRYITLTSVSESLLWGVRLMLARLGIVAWRAEGKAAGYRNVFGVDRLCQRSYTLTYTDNQKSWMGVVTDDYVGTHIELNERVDEVVTVYNLEVDEDESYLTVGGVVHNCLSSGMSYLRDRNILAIDVSEDAIDFEDKKLRERQEADAEFRKERAQKKGGNPYGA